MTPYYLMKTVKDVHPDLSKKALVRLNPDTINPIVDPNKYKLGSKELYKVNDLLSTVDGLKGKNIYFTDKDTFRVDAHNKPIMDDDDFLGGKSTTKRFKTYEFGPNDGIDQEMVDADYIIIRSITLEQTDLSFSNIEDTPEKLYDFVDKMEPQAVLIKGDGFGERILIVKYDLSSMSISANFTYDDAARTIANVASKTVRFDSPNFLKNERVVMELEFGNLK